MARRIELEVEHLYKNRFVGRHWFKQDIDLITVGSARSATIRLLGESVAGLNSSFELRDDLWILSDLGSEHGTWVNKKNVIEHEIRGNTIVRIGEHQLRVTPHDLTKDLFLKEDSEPNKQQGRFLYHQVIYRKNGFVVSSQLLKPKQSFFAIVGGEKKEFRPPADGGWIFHEFNESIIQQRMVRTDRHEESIVSLFSQVIDPSMRWPALGGLILSLFVVALFLFAPRFKSNELEQPEIKQNIYTKMIFDAKTTRKMKANSKKMASKIAAKSKAPPTSSSTKSSAPVAKHTPTKAVLKISKSLRNAGLSQLIGKISARASKNAIQIGAVGRAAGSGPTGRAMASVGSASLGKYEAATGKEYKIAGVSTTGRGGGGSGSGIGGGLSTGSVGSADVGIIEEETEVRGGLAKEVIAEHIKSKIGQIRYCYERQLTANPDLYGKVIIEFTIGGNGAVTEQSVATSTLKSSMVEGCMLRRISKWKFPLPEGGTSVVVKYPFLFKSTN